MTPELLLEGDDITEVRLQHWSMRARCAEEDPELFFPGKNEPTDEAKKVCKACPVKAECLEHAIKTGEYFGIWGALTEEERQNFGKFQPK